MFFLITESFSPETVRRIFYGLGESGQVEINEK